MAQTYNTIVWVFPGGCTDLIQPFDQGYGRAVKHWYNEFQQVWHRVTNASALQFMCAYFFEYTHRHTFSRVPTQTCIRTHKRA